MIVVRRLAFALLALATAGSSSRAMDDPRLIPKPREATTGDLVPLAKSVTITGAGNDDDRFAAKDLAEALKARGIRVAAGTDAGFRISLLRLDSPTARRVLDDNKIAFTDEMKAEGYVLLATKDGAVIVAATSAGLFYGAQTFKQLIRTDGPTPRVQLAVIRSEERRVGEE